MSSTATSWRMSVATPAGLAPRGMASSSSARRRRWARSTRSRSPDLTADANAFTTSHPSRSRPPRAPTDATRSHRTEQTLVSRQKTSTAVSGPGGWDPGPHTRPPPGENKVGGVSEAMSGLPRPGALGSSPTPGVLRHTPGSPGAAGARHPAVTPPGTPRRVARAVGRTKVGHLVTTTERVRHHMVRGVRARPTTDPAHVRQPEHSQSVTTVATRSRTRHQHHHHRQRSRNPEQYKPLRAGRAHVSYWHRCCNTTQAPVKPRRHGAPCVPCASPTREPGPRRPARRPGRPRTHHETRPAADAPDHAAPRTAG